MYKTISITVDVEEWFHTEWFNVEKIINKYYNGIYPKTDIEFCVNRLLNLFNRYDIKATFFILGETAEKYPDLIKNIRKYHHEIGCHSYYHNIKYNDLKNFKTDIISFRNNIYENSIGFRFPNFKISNKFLGIIKEEGYSYDSSIVPSLNIPGWYGNPKIQIKPHIYKFNGFDIAEFPIAVSPIFRFPGGGGWYLRNLGYFWSKIIIESLHHPKSKFSLKKYSKNLNLPKLATPKT